MSVLLRSVRAVTSSSRYFTTSSIASKIKPAPEPRGNLSTPADFIAAISRPRRDLSLAASAVGTEWSQLFNLSSAQLKQTGVPVRERKYLLWAVEKYRQGQDPQDFAVPLPPKKKVRGWGARVQTSERIRVRGRRRPGEK